VRKPESLLLCSLTLHLQCLFQNFCLEGVQLEESEVKRMLKESFVWSGLKDAAWFLETQHDFYFRLALKLPSKAGASLPALVGAIRGLGHMIWDEFCLEGVYFQVQWKAVCDWTAAFPAMTSVGEQGQPWNSSAGPSSGKPVFLDQPMSVKANWNRGEGDSLWWFQLEWRCLQSSDSFQSDCPWGNKALSCDFSVLAFFKGLS
jgi:hypothetical protein